MRIQVRLGRADRKADEEAGLPVKYETEKLDYIWPERPAYTRRTLAPVARAGLFIETKVKDVADRQKHLLIRDQCPDVEVRFVFSNANAKVNAYDLRAILREARHQIRHKTIPIEWFEEGDNDNEPERQDPDYLKKVVDQLGRANDLYRVRSLTRRIADLREQGHEIVSEWKHDRWVRTHALFRWRVNTTKER